jgi:pimeloyl-ACP methyl ester carboxylesterase
MSSLAHEFGTSVRHRVNGVALHGVEAGPADGPLVILLHGFPEFWWAWRRQIGPLAEAGMRVVAIDQRGYNLSDKPFGLRAYDLDTLAQDVVDLATAYGRPRAHVIGHDWGGLVAWWTASRHPDRVERLGILNAPHPEAAGPYLRRHPTQVARSGYIGFFQLPWIPETVLSSGDFALMRRTLQQTSRKGTFSPSDLDAYDEAWRQPGALTAMLNWYRALRHKPSLPDPKITAPTLVLWGMQDRFLEAGLAEDSLSLCEQGRLVRLEQATHWLHLEEPEAVNAALVEFLFQDAGA